MGTRWVSFQVDDDDHAAYEEEARRQTAANIRRVSLAEIARNEWVRGARRLRSKHKAADLWQRKQGDN